MKYTIILLILVSGCSTNTTPVSSAPNPCLPAPNQDLTKPGVLIVGDSVSMGYLPIVQQSLPNVTHSPCNNESTAFAQEYMKTWGSYRKHWSLITFNHGLWDLAYRQPYIPTYIANLRIEAEYYLSISDKVVFFTTTEIPQANVIGTPGAIGFTNDDVDAFNAAATQLMTELGVQVYDLNAYSKTIDSLHISINNIHWTQQGYVDLANFVIMAIMQEEL
jgi:hypothetical protein